MPGGDACRWVLALVGNCQDCTHVFVHKLKWCILPQLQEAHETGVALVVACPQDNAERYCEGLRLNGLTSTIEPGGC